MEVVLHHVTFNEALEALKIGTPIHWFSSTTNKAIRFNPDEYQIALKGLSLYDLHNGGWAIEGGILQ